MPSGADTAKLSFATSPSTDQTALPTKKSRRPFAVEQRIAVFDEAGKPGQCRRREEASIPRTLARIIHEGPVSDGGCP